MARKSVSHADNTGSNPVRGAKFHSSLAQWQSDVLLTHKVRVRLSRLEPYSIAINRRYNFNALSSNWQRPLPLKQMILVRIKSRQPNPKGIYV